MPNKKDRSQKKGQSGSNAAMAVAAPGARKAKRPATSSDLGRRWPLLVGLTSLIGVLLAAAMIVLNLMSVAASRQIPISAAPLSAAPGNPNSSLVDRRTKGRPDAPVVITEWFDFQCPACGRFALTREPEIEKQYVDTGKARYVARNFAFLGPESFLAAEAAEAAAEQGRYWDYYRLLFSRQQGENQGAFRPENLKRFAAELGLDQKAFNDALDQGKYRAAVIAEGKEGEALGIKATPTFFVNGKPVNGVPTVEQMGKLIEAELAKKQ